MILFLKLSIQWPNFSKNVNRNYGMGDKKLDWKWELKLC